MSLQVWLPLTGSLINQGLADVTIANSGAAVNNNGKVGRCYSFDGSDDFISLDSATLRSIPKGSTYQMSFTMWVYHADSTRAILFGDWSLPNTIGFNIELGTDHRVRFYWNGSPDITFANSSVRESTWTHLAVTYSGTELKCYVNGVAVATHTVTLGSLTKTAGLFYLGRDNRTGTTALNGRLNDFRVYDHCLSTREVKEISKGLVLHYPLNRIENTNSRNKYSGETFLGNSSSSSYTKSKNTDGEGYRYTLSYTGTGSNTWPNIQFPVFSFTAGKTYDYSCKVRVNSANFNIYMRASHIANDWVTSMTNVVSSSKVDGNWREYHIRIVINSTWVRSGTEYNCSPLLEFYSDSLATSGTAYSCNFDIKDVCVCECAFDAPINNGGWSDNVEFDCSGNGFSGQCINSISLSNDTPRNQVCYTFPDGTGHIKAPRPLPSNPSEMTVSCWVKPSSSNGGYSIYASNYNNPSSGFWLATNCEGCGLWYYNSGLYIRGSATVNNDSWYHIVLTYNNGTYQWYLNGNAVTTTLSTTSKAPTLTDYIGVGNSYTGTTWNTKRYGCLSDFRIYTTALSLDDIKELYTTPVIVTKSGTLMTRGEFIEE